MLQRCFQSIKSGLLLVIVNYDCLLLLLLQRRCLSIRIVIESVKKQSYFLDNVGCQQRKILEHYTIDNEVLRKRKFQINLANAKHNLAPF
jgi:hypothetical protein